MNYPKWLREDQA